MPERNSTVELAQTLAVDGIPGDPRTATRDPVPTKSEMLRELDRQLAELSEAIALQRLPGVNDIEIASMESRAGALLALRQSIEGARSPEALALLAKQYVEAVRETTQAALAVAAGAVAGRVSSDIKYEAKMAVIESQMRDLVREDASRFSETSTLARNHGVDIGAYESERLALEQEAEECRKQGDRLGALTANTLNAWNTANAAQQVADGIDEPEAKAAAQANADAAKAAALKAEQALHEAARIQAEQEAAQNEFSSPESRQAWVDARVDSTMTAYENRKASLPSSAGMSDDRVSEITADVSSIVAETNTADRTRVALSPKAVHDWADAAPVDAARSEADLMAGLSPNPAIVDPAALPAAVRLAAAEAAAPVAQDTSQSSAETITTQPGLAGRNPSPGANDKTTVLI